MRNLNEEFTDNEHRQYAYDFDYKMHAYMMRSFQPYLPSGRAVELGCYHGMFTERLTGFYDDVSVVEGASDLIDIARTHVGDSVTFHHSMFEDFEPEQPFDAAFLMHTLEHLDGPVEVLRRIGSWLSPQGKLFVAVPNAHAASRQIAVGMGLISHASAVTEGEALHGHRCTYSIDTLVADIKAAGLHVEDFGGVMFKPLANYQFDACLQNGTVDDAFLEGCYVLGKRYPDLCASIYAVCTPAPQ
ncbi:class I SAM-dependent methyltransferase [Roseobacter sp. EG26]|uniref:class I SAM-dependent methyltransferase n=1 Tax=Roseobacter sp. EG26 TaxID=3412477 RepID=UPI003CE5AF76